MKQFEDKSLNLILLQIVGPILIMLMVSSLVFFLIEVVYRGPHTQRIYWVMGLFTIASVLVARIAIEEGLSRAQLFGLALAIATLIASMQLVEFAMLPVLRPLVLIGLISIVMWTANKLTWDCTVVDRSRDVSSSGLLERLKREWTQATDKDTEDSHLKKIWNFFVLGSKSNSPGTWVFYFALIAFPLFGIGQWFVRPESGLWIYVLFAVYFASALGLLLTTSLLGLERYLAKRNVHVPVAIARNWMILGGGFTLAVMFLVLLIPKPGGAGTFQDALAALSSPFRQASRFAPGNDGQEDDPGAKAQKINANAENVQPGEGNGEASDDNKRRGENRPNDDQSDGGDGGDRNSNNQKGEASNGKPEQNSQTESKNRPDPENNRNRNADVQDEERGQQNQQSKESRQRDDRGQNDIQQRQRGAQRKQNAANPPEQQNRPPQQQNRSQQQPSQANMQQIFDQISKFANWLIYLIGGIAAIVLLFLFRHEIAALLNLLMGKRKDKESREPESVAEPTPAPRTPFNRFKNPFQNGHPGKPLAELVNYSMLALEAWGRDLGVDRNEDETPTEFARRLHSIDAKTSKSARQLAELYNRCAFGGKPKVQADTTPLVELWRRMESVYRKRRQAINAEAALR